MHNPIPPVFKLSALAAAVLTLSGCASSSLPSSIGDTLMGAGRVTADASVRAFENTSNIIGLNRLQRGGESDAINSDDAEIAALDATNTWPAEQSTAVAAPGVKPAAAVALPTDMPAIASIPAIDPNAVQVALVDYTHTVGQEETMWTIAKSTTGNANNWRILAEINQLDLNTPMQIGQEILIPADLVLPEIVATLEPSQLLAPSTPAAAQAPAQSLVIADADNQNGIALPPLELGGASDGAIRPVTQASLESDPINLNSADGNLDGADDDAMIIVEASAPAQPAADAASEIDPSLNAVALTADAGETLWDMSKRTTGDATNWQAIAEHNGFSDADIGRIRYGQTIFIPAELAKAEFGGDKVVEEAVAAVDLTQPEAQSDANALAATATDVKPNTDEESVEVSAELLASASNLMDETQDIKIIEAKYQSDDAVEIATDDAIGDNQIIMVSGTYYPKAVYNAADFSASLLMRVSPGTQMTVSRAVGPWYEVQTENGVGYMHSRDIK